MTKKLQSLYKGLLAMIMVSISLQTTAQKVWTDTYVGGTASSAQWAVWNNFRGTLVPLPYSKMKVTGVSTVGSTVYVAVDSCIDPVIVQDIANRLYTFTPTSATYTWVDGTRTWRVGQCGTGAELTLNQNICACTSPGHSIRGGCTSCGSNYGAWCPIGSSWSDCGAPTITFTLEFFYGYPCTSVPTANITGPYQVCPNKQFKVQPDKFYADATYSWSYSDNNGASWVNWTGAVDPYSGAITDVISAPRTYQLTITCINNTTLTYTTPTWTVGIAPFMYCYCDGSLPNAAGLDIGNVKLVNKKNSTVELNNGSSTPALSNTNAKNTYTSFQYSVAPIPMYKNTKYDISVTEINSASTFKQGNVAAFIDFNRDGIFDGNEKVLSKTISTASIVPYTESDSFDVPATAQYGLTGMRVILSTGTTDSCGIIPGGSTEGEIEDYIIDLRYDPCTGPANAGAVISKTPTLCKGYDYVVTDTTYEKKQSALSRVWQISGDNIYWTTIAGSDDKDTLMRVFNGQPTYYRNRMICLSTSDTTYSASYLIGPKAGYKCYCYSQAEGGIAKDSSDIGGLSIASVLKSKSGAHLMNPNATDKRLDFTDDAPTILFTDSTYQFTIYHIMKSVEHGDAKITVFMDFDNDKEYDAPYERVYTGFTSIGYFTIVDNIYIPNKVITNVPTGMRVVLNNDIAPNTPSDLGCGGYTSGQTMDFIVQFQRKFASGIENVSGINDFDIFPNPNNGKFRLQFTTNNKPSDVIVNITNVTGQVIEQYSFKHDGGVFTKEIDMSNHSAGVYFAEIKCGDEMAKKKLIIK